MRNLLIMVGSPGSGKSTWIKENNLEQYTVSPDVLRMLYSTPVLAKDGSLGISQSNDRKVWELLWEIVEDRMSRGVFTVVDATHTRQKYLNSYKKLAEKYRYRMYAKVMDTDLEELHRRNESREPLKRVPSEIIDIHYERLQSFTIPKGFTQIDDIREVNEFVKYRDVSEYNKVHVIGDVHGMNDTLQDFLDDKRNDDDLFIFVGDYIDRGEDSGATMNMMYELIQKDNVICLEGNHERWLWYWGNSEWNKIRNSKFKTDTVPQFDNAGFTQGMAREFYRRLWLFCPIEKGGNKFIITHGGVSTPNIDFISSEQIIKGVDRYEFLDEVYESFNSNEEGIYQIHGHRNIQLYPIQPEVGERHLSYNLEGNVESGGGLRVVTISDDDIETKEYKSKTNPSEKFTESGLGDMEDSKFIQRKNLGGGLHSWNFTRNAFKKKMWDETTIKARGLFTNDDGDVVARSYDKFFNIGERPETQKSVLKMREGTFDAYYKYNGYLGIASYVNGGVMFFSKTTNSGPYAEKFEELYNEMYDIKLLEKYLSENNVSLMFEVIDPVFDPHIIEYHTKWVVLIGGVHNKIDESVYLSYEELVDVSKAIGTQVKTPYKKDVPWSELDNMIKDYNETHLGEGLVLEDDTGFFVKHKSPFYSKWKYMRGLMSQINKGTMNRVTDCFNEELIPVCEWYMNTDETYDNVIDLRNAYEETLS